MTPLEAAVMAFEALERRDHQEAIDRSYGLTVYLQEAEEKLALPSSMYVRLTRAFPRSLGPHLEVERKQR